MAERDRVAAEYRRVLKSSVEFERQIRDRWREKSRAKNRRIRQLEERVAELERRLERRSGEKETIMERDSKERKMVALMLNDLGMSDVQETDMVRMNEEIGALSDEELDGMLASRLGLDPPVDDRELDEALVLVEEPERISTQSSGGFTGAPDMSHEARPEERE